MTDTPDAITLFALYHLGLDSDGNYRFRNFHECARSLKVDTETLERWLKAAKLDAESIGLVEFNMTAAHVDAQFTAQADVPTFIAATWSAFDTARSLAPRASIRMDVNYDAIWGIDGNVAGTSGASESDDTGSDDTGSDDTGSDDTGNSDPEKQN